MSVSVWSHPLYRWYNTHSMTSHLLYIWQNMHCIWQLTHNLWHHNTSHDIKAIISHLTQIISESTSTASLSSHKIIDHTTPILCMITQPQYVWYHMNYIWHHIHSLWYHTTLWHHTYCIHVITPRIHVIASTVAGPLLIVYWLYYTYYMCDMKPTIFMHLRNSIWNHTHSLWHNDTVFMTSYPLYSWQHTHSIWHHILYTCDIRATVSMTRHLLCLWCHSQYIWHLTWCMNHNTTMVSDITLTVFV